MEEERDYPSLPSAGQRHCCSLSSDARAVLAQTWVCLVYIGLHSFIPSEAHLYSFYAAICRPMACGNECSHSANPLRLPPAP